jgi:flavin-dependent dehydrogenase
MTRARSFDALVVGAGSTGAMAALALAQSGLRVGVVDERDAPGARWINGVPPWCFDEARVPRPLAPERWGGEGEHGFVLTTASGKARVRVERNRIMHVDMRHLTARLRRDAERAGAIFSQERVTGAHVERGRVRRVHVEGGEIRAALVVDASGLRGIVRRSVPSLAARCPDVDARDICAAAQETFSVADRDAARAFLEGHGVAPGESLGFLGLEGGYSTLSLFTEPTLTEIGVLTGSIPSSGAPNGARMLASFVERSPWIGERLFGGRGAIPLRRPYATLGAAGVALVGDAACQVYGAHGSGVGMGIVAARILADAVSGLSDPGSAEALSRYERRFHRSHGGVLAGADAFRRFSETLSESDIEALMDAGLLDAELFSRGLEQRPPRAHPAWLARTAARAVETPRAAAMVLPAVAKVAMLQSIAGLLGRTPDERARSLLDRAIGAMVGAPERD